MARYVRAPEEVELFREMVDGVRNKKRAPAFLVLTDRRVVVLVAGPAPWSSWLWGALGHWIVQQLTGIELLHQIDRDDFAAVELEGRQMLSFHSKGEGYGHISFVVYSRTSFPVWQQRMHQWVAGTLSTAPIPTAVLVDR